MLSCSSEVVIVVGLMLVLVARLIDYIRLRLVSLKLLC